MEILFKFQVNRMKNDDFRNLTSRCHLTIKSIGFCLWLPQPFPELLWRSVLNYDLRQTEKQEIHCAEHDTCEIPETNLTLIIIDGWIQWPNMQILFKFQVNWMKIDNFRNSAHVVWHYFSLGTREVGLIHGGKGELSPILLIGIVLKKKSIYLFI